MGITAVIDPLDVLNRVAMGLLRAWRSSGPAISQRVRTVEDAEGLMEYSAPQIAGRDESFGSAIREHLKGYTPGLEDLALRISPDRLL